MACPLVDLPVIDFSESADRTQKSKDLTKAMEEIGFVYLDNVPGFDKQVEDRLHDACKWFFGLPLEEKMKISTVNWNSSAKGMYRGYMPINVERDQLREQYGTGETLPDDDPYRLSGNPFYEATPYPFPDKKEGIEFRELIESTRQVLTKASLEFFHLLAIGLGLDEDAFDEKFVPRQLSTLRLMHYPTYKAVRSDLNTFTCEEHVDTVFVTLLITFGYAGLEIERSDGSWMKVPPRPGSLVVNIGMLLSRLSNMRFKATKHRVRDIGGDRYSMPFFLEPRGDAQFTFPDDSSTIVYGKWAIDKMRRFKYQFGHLPDYKV